MKILIVDDSRENRYIMKHIIESHGHEVIEAEDGQDGLEKVATNKPDFIITDALMPRVDGFQFLRNVKKNAYFKSIPCIFYSGVYTGDKDRELAIALGAKAFIAKPKTPDALWEEIKPILALKQTEEIAIERELIDDEEEFIRNYCPIVVAKLEEKVRELEKVVTEHEHMENALRNSKEQLQAILDNTTAVIYLKDTKGRYLLVNRQFEKLFHMNKSQILGKTNYDLFPKDKDMVDAVRMNDQRVIETKASLMLEEVVPFEDGLHTYISLKFPMYDSHGVLYGVCGVSTDITERKRIEDTLRNITEGISAKIGNTFFSSLVLYVANVLEMDYVLVGELSDDNEKVNTLSVCAHGKIAEDFTYQLSGTPCLNVMNSGTCIYSGNVQQQFPDDHLLSEMGAKSYAGTPLYNSEGKPFGILVVVDCKELHNPHLVKSILQIFAIRTSAELERIQVEKSLLKSEASLANAQRIAHLGSWEWNIVKNTLHWSDEIYRIFGLTPHSFGATYEAFLQSVHPDDREFVKKSVNGALYEKKPYRIDYRIVLSDGSERIVHEQAEVIYDSTGKAIHMNGTVQDVTEHKKAEAELRKLSAAIERSVNTLFITDIQGNIEYVNPMFEYITGYHKDEVIGQNPRILASGATLRSVYEEQWKTILSGKTWRGVFENKKKNGQYYWANGLISPISNEKGQITHFLAVQEDITEKMEKDERIRYLASYDNLTGLLNRARFMEVMNEWISYASINISIGILLLLNIDKFRLINDAYGNLVGDNLLRHVAKILQDTLCNMDTQYFSSVGKEKAIKESILGRLSGDEFVIFLPSRDEKEGMETAEYIRKRFEEFQFVEIPGHLTTSIGVVSYPKHGITSYELLTKSNAALYRAKELGENKVHLYHPEDHILEKMHSRIAWKGKIQTALREDRFDPWFQPILDLKDNKVHHYEALARMRDEVGNIIMPGAFIVVAEQFGLITDIDRTIISKSMSVQSGLRKQGKPLSFSINLSGKDIGNVTLLEFLKSKLRETGADPKCLIFEITETEAIQDLDKAIKFINDLKSLGCCLSLDDFGVGFTSFQYLKEMKVDYIKIDGSFIRKLHENKSDHLFVKAITDVAKGMEIKTIAEFVEHEDTVRILRDLGVDYAQGYLIGKPAPHVQ